MPTTRILTIATVIAAVGFAALPSVPARAPAPTLTESFPRIAGLIRHFEERMRSPDASVRKRVLTELTYFHRCNSEIYPPFLRYLLSDDSPVVRWAAIRKLRDHGIFLSADEVPESYEVPLVGLCEPGDPDSLASFRAIAAGNPNVAKAGWAITALAVAKDEAAIDLLGPLTDSENVFVRFSAAVGYLELGQEETGLELLVGITKPDTDQSGSAYYRQKSAELLVRAGQREYLETIIETTSHLFSQGSSDSGISILADLTGRYFATPKEWSAWWAQQDTASPDDSCE